MNAAAEIAPRGAAPAAPVTSVRATEAGVMATIALPTSSATRPENDERSTVCRPELHRRAPTLALMQLAELW